MLKPPSSWCWWIYLEDDDHVTMFDPRQRQRFEPLPGNHTYLVPVKHLGSDVGRLRRYTWKRSGGTIDGGKSSCSDGWKDVKRWRDKLIVLIKSCQSFSRFFTRESSCGLSKCDLPPKGHQETNFDWIGWIGWNMFTGNHHIKNGKNPGFRWRFSQQNQSFGKSLQVTTGWDGGAPHDPVVKPPSEGWMMEVSPGWIQEMDLNLHFSWIPTKYSRSGWWIQEKDLYWTNSLPNLNEIRCK